jgi:hypothetical protein
VHALGGRRVWVAQPRKGRKRVSRLRSSGGGGGGGVKRRRLSEPGVPAPALSIPMRLSSELRRKLNLQAASVRQLIRTKVRLFQGTVIFLQLRIGRVGLGTGQCRIRKWAPCSTSGPSDYGAEESNNLKGKVKVEKQLVGLPWAADCCPWGTTGRQRMGLERGTNPKLPRRACSPRYELRWCWRDWAGVAKRPRVNSSPPGNPYWSDSHPPNRGSLLSLTS